MTGVLVDEEATHLDGFHDVEWLDDGAAFTFISERSGWRHVHRVSRDGQSIVDLTPGAFDVAELVAVNEDSNALYFTASPDDMAARYLYRSSLDGSGEAQNLLVTLPNGYRFKRSVLQYADNTSLILLDARDLARLGEHLLSE